MLTQEPNLAVPSPSPRPAPRAFRVHAAAGSPGLLRLSGPLDTAATPALEAALRPYRRGAPSLIIDLRTVEYIETPGLRLLLALSDELPAGGGRLSLVARPGSRVERTLRLSGLDRRCPVYPTPREAWAGPPGWQNTPGTPFPKDSGGGMEEGDDHDTG